MAFTALAVVVLLGGVGVLAASLYFIVGFTVFHVIGGLYLSVQIYYLGRWRLGMFITSLLQQFLRVEFRLWTFPKNLQYLEKVNIHVIYYCHSIKLLN
jgi:hypothetical protein